MAALLLLVTAAAAASLGDLTRRETGDVFTLIGDECGAAQCAEHGAGAITDDASIAGGCACACPQRAPLFREDRELCVDDLPECALATFGTGNAIQRIPFVFLPLKGQIIHPSREITFHNVKTPICAVSGAQFLTTKGFLDLRNTLDADVPFSLFRDEGRTFLQWSGEEDVRARMSGRVMVVRLLCRDVSTSPASPLDLRGVFTPCVAFRVQGTPPRHATNITEVQFTPTAHTSDTPAATGLSASEYVAIGVSSLLLGLIYVASVFLYLHIRKRRKASSEENSLRRTKGRKRDGTIISERDILRINNERVSISNALGEDGIIKNNPLLAVGRSFDKSNYPSDSCSNLSDSEDLPDSSLKSEDHVFNKRTTSAIIHLHSEELVNPFENVEINHRDESGIERLPDEHVSIVETIDDREIARPVGTTRRKLYFNPAYFEPQFMTDPPAAAIEFLSKIREVISIAKQKMAAKRFHPVLNEIPEEETYHSNANSIDLYNALGSQRSGSVISLKRGNTRRRSSECLGCPGCQSNSNNDIQNIIKNNVQNCTNCLNTKGDKQSSIREWLDNIPSENEEIVEDSETDDQIRMPRSLQSLTGGENRNKLKKQYSFTEGFSMFSNISKKSTSPSVRSEPTLRNFHSQLDKSQKSKLNELLSSSTRDTESDSRIRNMTNNNSLPDMVNDAININDQFSKPYNQISSDEERFILSSSKNIIDKAYFNSSESPITNDYETDSLERNSNKKDITTSSTPIEFHEIPSSQASPSLSTALPLDEELTMRNAVYKRNSSSDSNTPSPEVDLCINQNLHETVNAKSPSQNKIVPSYSLVTEVYVNNSYNFSSAPTSPSGSECSMGSRKLVTIPNLDEKPGCLTIEVKDPPENYIKIHESDGFEPDTLDRKQQKHKEILENMQFSRKDLLRSLDDHGTKSCQRIQLRSSGTFLHNGKTEHTTKFNSLRCGYDIKNSLVRPKMSPNIFNSSTHEESSDRSLEDSGGWTSEEGRMLTLELRHSKRQRQCTPPTIKQMKHLARPDVLPPLPPIDNPIYENPSSPPRRVESGVIFDPRSNSQNSLNIRGENTSTEESNLCNHDSIDTPSCSPINSSFQSQTISEYDDMNPSSTSQISRPNEYTVSTTRRNSVRNKSAINSNTFVKDQKFEKPKLRRKKGMSIEDSGYLSSDSANSRQFHRKLVIAKIASCSDSDDTGNEARSESGAESVETHSVYFGSFRNLQPRPELNTIKSVRSKLKVKN